MCIYLVVNVENLKLYDPSILDYEEEHVLPSVEDLAPNSQEELKEDTFCKRGLELQYRGSMTFGSWG